MAKKKKSYKTTPQSCEFDASVGAVRKIDLSQMEDTMQEDVGTTFHGENFQVGGYPSPPSSYGMMLDERILRDYFAAAALQGMMSREAVNWKHTSIHNATETVKFAYQLADAMLKARQDR